MCFMLNIVFSQTTRDVQGIADLLSSCSTLTITAEKAGIIDRCIAAIVDCWLTSFSVVPWRFNNTITSNYQHQDPGGNKQTEENQVRLLQTLSAIPFDWFLRVCVFFSMVHDVNTNQVMFTNIFYLFAYFKQS